MLNILKQAQSEIVQVLRQASGFEGITEKDLVFPPNYTLGDLSFPCFGLVKIFQKSPEEISTQIYKKLKPSSLISRIELVGPYLNFFLNREKVGKNFFQEIVKKRKKEKEKKDKQERVMIEFISPNNNKPLHLGHLRNAFLGESIARLLEWQGIKVIRACLFNDRGLHIAKSILAYQLWGKGITPKKLNIKGDKFVGDLYVKFEQEAKLHPELLEEAERIVQLWEKGDKKIRVLWKKLNNWVLKAFFATFKRLGLRFDIYYFESKLWQKGKKLVFEGLKKGILKKDKTGNIIADLKTFNLPPKVLLRADGTAIYSTTDLYLGKEKFEKNKLTRAIWCVGSEQDLYLKQLFVIYQLFGFPWFDRCFHLSYGLVFLPEGKMKSREGKVVEADDLLDQLFQMVEEEIKARHKKISKKEMIKRAEAIAQAALRFYLLLASPKTTVHFNPKESIALSGRTGPYLLYTYARIASILRKSKLSQLSFSLDEFKDEKEIKINDLEWQLILLINRFPEVIQEAALHYNPSILAQYLYDLAKRFSDFYETNPVLKAESKIRKRRLVLITALKNVLGEGLRLLTIEPIERM
jgi:arginyl-tRNA synthetase